MNIIGEKLHKEYPLHSGNSDAQPDAVLCAVNQCDLVIEHGKITCISGVSGSGKTTLLEMLALLRKPTSGRLFFDQTDVLSLSEDEQAAWRNEKIGFVPQNSGLIPFLTAEENIHLPLMIAGAVKSTDDRQLIHRLGIRDCLHHLPGELSGGQKQRVALARALICQPEIFMADEPTNHLDSENVQLFLTLLAEWKAAGMTIVFTTHDPRLLQCADRIIRMDGGKIIP